MTKDVRATVGAPIDLLHMLGEAPEGPWAVFSLPDGDGTHMVSVIVPRSLWMKLTRLDPFSSEIAIMERIGIRAIERRRQAGPLLGPVLVELADVEDQAPGLPWYQVLRTCGQCGQMVPAGEVLEGLGNALPPNSRGEIELKVLCPTCQVQTPHCLTPWELLE
ncbi:MAG: hypothetical protein C7B46_05595 [Sulfobacillus benefaciens]|uniref:Uncharacterized protein n=1 Tax=Sulfobacillus benefaciens TaxID=453960 RepID=A0A2T2XIR3_9FIRM|nr:MAG: hypothetical protein C7B46_05595 [Sulfobacillus benefaciens]